MVGLLAALVALIPHMPWSAGGDGAAPRRRRAAAELRRRTTGSSRPPSSRRSRARRCRTVDPPDPAAETASARRLPSSRLLLQVTDRPTGPRPASLTRVMDRAPARLYGGTNRGSVMTKVQKTEAEWR